MFNYIDINGYQIRIAQVFSDKHIFNKKDICLALNIKYKKNNQTSIDVVELTRLWLKSKNKIDDLYDILDSNKIDLASSVDVYPALDEEWQELQIAQIKAPKNHSE
ncbi:hypothetical protein [Photobacterium damselae]|uniref:hypothetical protein n=1 Tax=Photobacterium damselae TaxID=38293 RepID=UPI000D05CFCA|nr:hypothetical protein [Photobacterium damselae]AWK83044.1 hypothetical protein BST98_14085 [Photobacterium damselae]PSB81248.1 hypothetical protein C5F61_02140 [Photobacterium damselae subsp. damselae]SUB91503.1 Uncharacterised protein [Photobacterium damselae]